MTLDGVGSAGNAGADCDMMELARSASCAEVGGAGAVLAGAGASGTASGAASSLGASGPPLASAGGGGGGGSTAVSPSWGGSMASAGRQRAEKRI